jgi:murein L,D-transpeptidase YafK
MAFMILVLAVPGAGAADLAIDAPDHILVLKARRELLLMAADRIIRSYPIALGGSPLGAKLAQGDDRTPEGHYVIDGRNPKSRFHLALHLSYPNAADALRARATGRAPGGDIMIHGLPDEDDDGGVDPVVFYEDWTHGCIAVGNRAIEEIWALVPDGIRVEIEP